MKRILMLYAMGLLAFTMLAGCASTVGPKVLKNSYIDYNETVRKVVSEEILLTLSGVATTRRHSLQL
jgi:hypothetical protein